MAHSISFSLVELLRNNYKGMILKKRKKANKMDKKMMKMTHKKILDLSKSENLILLQMETHFLTLLNRNRIAKINDIVYLIILKIHNKLNNNVE